MAKQITLSTDKNRITVSPGADVELRVTIQNLTTLVDDVSVSIAGIEESWGQVIPPHLPVFAQGEASVRVIIQPPADPLSVVAGIYPLRIMGALQESAGQSVETAVELEIQFSGDYRIELGKGTFLNNQEATFPFIVHNDANAPLNIRCFGEDPQNSFWYKFEPFQFTVPSGGNTTTTLSVRSKQPQANSQNVIFTLKTQGEWTIAGLSSIDAAVKQVSGQWQQRALPNIILSINPSRIEDKNKGNYQLVINNPGLTAETITLEGSNVNGQLNFQFEPPQLRLAPQSQGVVMLTVWPTGGSTPSGQLVFDFRVTARPANGNAKPGSIQATFVQGEGTPDKKWPAWLLPVLIGIMILLLVCLIGSFILYNMLVPRSISWGVNGHILLWVNFFTRRVLDGSILSYFS